MVKVAKALVRDWCTGPPVIIVTTSIVCARPYGSEHVNSAVKILPGARPASVHRVPAVNVFSCALMRHSLRPRHSRSITALLLPTVQPPALCWPHTPAGAEPNDANLICEIE